MSILYIISNQFKIPVLLSSFNKYYTKRVSKNKNQCVFSIKNTR